MDYQILDIVTKKLLKKFGAGSHKPGSGSGAALQGMIAANFVRTVALLTVDKPKYFEKHTEFAAYIEEIDDELLPELGKLCQQDSEQLESVIRAREDRDKAKSISTDKFVELAARALGELKPATDIPIRIAEHSMRVAELAVRVFEHGFQHARGDSSVALNSAISSIAGCVSIIDLNLTSFAHDEWTQEIRERTEPIRKALVDFKKLEFDLQEKLKREAESKAPFQLLLSEFRTGTWAGKSISDSEIELLARSVQATIWRNRHRIWNDQIPTSPLQVIHPELAIKLLGYQYNLVDSLGHYELSGQMVEVAGIINHDDPAIDISMQFPIEIRNFTSAHELGHSLLHKQSGLHRDRAIDGSELLAPRDWRERQADWFASCYLMPRNLTATVFDELYLTKRFGVTHETAFAMNFSSVGKLVQEIEKLRGENDTATRGLSRLLASHQTYNGKRFPHIASQLKVSTEAMAIRLEELNLVESL